MPCTLTDPADVEAALSNVDDSKSSGDELDSREEPCCRSGTDDAAEPGSDSTRDELSAGSDLDPSPAAVDPGTEVCSAPVPMPRRRKAASSFKAAAEQKSEAVEPMSPSVRTRQQKRAAAAKRQAGTAATRQHEEGSSVTGVHGLARL